MDLLSIKPSVSLLPPENSLAQEHTRRSKKESEAEGTRWV